MEIVANRTLGSGVAPPRAPRHRFRDNDRGRRANDLLWCSARISVITRRTASTTASGPSACCSIMRWPRVDSAARRGCSSWNQYSLRDSVAFAYCGPGGRNGVEAVSTKSGRFPKSPAERTSAMLSSKTQPSPSVCAVVGLLDRKINSFRCGWAKFASPNGRPAPDQAAGRDLQAGTKNSDRQLP